MQFGSPRIQNLAPTASMYVMCLLLYKQLLCHCFKCMYISIINTIIDRLYIIKYLCKN